MKYILFLLVVLMPAGLRAQIKLEHVYPINNNYAFGLVEVDSGDWRYVTFNQRDSINIFFLDHSLDRTIIVPIKIISDVINLSKHLFDLDDAYEYMLFDGINAYVYKEDGRLVLSIDTCLLGSNPHAGFRPVGPNLSPFIQTPNGAKLLVFRFGTQGGERREVYSLPGKLFGCVTLADDKVSPSTDGGMSASAYPNPSSGSQIHIDYDLPVGVRSGKLVLVSETGQVLKQYTVTDTFSDVELNSSELPSGTYFYKLITEKGESAAKRLVWLR